jgi:hypothetical protein
MPTHTRLPLPDNYAVFFPIFSVGLHQSTMVMWYNMTLLPAIPINPNLSAAAFVSRFTLLFTANLSTPWKFLGANCRINIGGVVFDGGEGVSNPGTAGASPLPESTAVVIRKITATPGRIGRGRWYFPGLDESQNDAGILNPLSLLSFNTLGDLMGSAYTDPQLGNIFPVLLNSVGSPAGTPPATFIPIIQCVADIELSNLRRRSPRFD